MTYFKNLTITNDWILRGIRKDYKTKPTLPYSIANFNVNLVKSQNKLQGKKFFYFKIL